jgi:hypothetical protein
MASGAPDRGGGCPDLETLSAFADRALSAGEARDVEHHVASCPSCARVLAMVIASEPEAAIAATPHRTWLGWRWAVPVATAAAVAGLWVATTREGQLPERAPSIASQPSGPASAAGSPELNRETPSAAPPESAPAPAPRDEGLVQISPSSPSVTVRGESPSVNVQRESPAVGQAGQQAAGAAPSAPAPAPESLQETVSVMPGFLVPSPVAAIVWRVGGSAIERSTDGGAAWRTEYTADRLVLAGAAVNGDVAWMAGQRGLVLRRTASGWSVASAPTSADLSSVEAVSTMEAIVRLADGTGFRTVDGGATWTSR